MTLAAYLKVTDQTYEDFAPQVDAKPRTVGKWARGERIPRPAKMALIRTATNEQVSPADFYHPTSISTLAGVEALAGTG